MKYTWIFHICKISAFGQGFLGETFLNTWKIQVYAAYYQGSLSKFSTEIHGFCRFAAEVVEILGSKGAKFAEEKPRRCSTVFGADWKKTLQSGAPTSIKCTYNPNKWLYQWVTGVITPISGVRTVLITGRGRPCIYWVYSHDDANFSDFSTFSMQAIRSKPCIYSTPVNLQSNDTWSLWKMCFSVENSVIFHCHIGLPKE